MNYQFAPFRMGISDVSPEEMDAMKKKAKVITDQMVRGCVLGCLIVAEIGLRLTANALETSSSVLLDASYVVADKHAVVTRELSYIEEGEVLEVA